MTIIAKYEDVLRLISLYLSDCKKSDFRRNELEFLVIQDLKDKNKNNAVTNAIYLQLVSKIYLLHDMIGATERLVSKCMIKKMGVDDTCCFGQYFKEKDAKLLTNVINNLSDTPYVIILSSLSYEIMDKLIQSDTITRAFWNEAETMSPFMIVTNNVFQIERHQLQDKLAKVTSGDGYQVNTTRNFETQLLQLLLAVTNVNKTHPVSQTYTFWIFKIDSLMFGVLVPKFETAKGSLINVWPIVPSVTFFCATKLINNLKIPNSDKSIFLSIAASIKSVNSLNSINIRREIISGMTLPMLLKNRVSLNNLYMSFFFEFLKEKQHYIYAMPKCDMANYLKCKHCNTIYNNVFDFVRHWWQMKNKNIFRCHLCDERLCNLTRLGNHYRFKHCTLLQDCAHGLRQINSNSSYCINKSSLNEEKTKTMLRLCPICNKCKEGLHLMRNHLRNDHIKEIVHLTLIKMKEKEIINSADTMFHNSLKVQSGDNQLSPQLCRGRYTRLQFQTLFNYKVFCPLCPKTAERYFTDQMFYLTHLARDHTSSLSDLNSSASIASKDSSTLKKYPLVVSANSDTTTSSSTSTPFNILLNSRSTTDSCTETELLPITQSHLSQTEDIILTNQKPYQKPQVLNNRLNSTSPPPLITKLKNIQPFANTISDNTTSFDDDVSTCDVDDDTIVNDNPIPIPNSIQPQLKSLQQPSKPFRQQQNHYKHNNLNQQLHNQPVISKNHKFNQHNTTKNHSTVYNLSQISPIPTENMVQYLPIQNQLTASMNSGIVCHQALYHKSFSEPHSLNEHKSGLTSNKWIDIQVHSPENEIILEEDPTPNIQHKSKYSHRRSKSFYFMSYDDSFVIDDDSLQSSNETNDMEDVTLHDYNDIVNIANDTVDEVLDENSECPVSSYYTY